MDTAVIAPYRFGRFELNPTTRQVVTDGKPVMLGAGTLGGNEPFHRRSPVLEQSDDAPQNAEGDDGSEGRGGDGQGRTGGKVQSSAHKQSPQRIGRKGLVLQGTGSACAAHSVL